MKYTIFVFGVQNIGEIYSMIPPCLHASRLKSLSDNGGDILKIGVGNSRRVRDELSSVETLMSLVEKLRGLRAKVRIAHPESTQTSFELEEGDHIFSEKLFPEIFFNSDEEIIDKIRGLQTREDYSNFLEYCPYLDVVTRHVYRTIINRGLFYEFRDLIPEDFIINECIAYHLDDPDLEYARGNTQQGVFNLCTTHNSVNIMSKYLETNSIKSNMQVHLPLSKEMEELLGRYNISLSILREDQRLWETMQAIYAKDLNWMENAGKRLAVHTIDNLRMFIMRENPPEIVASYKQLSSNLEPRLLDNSTFSLI